LNASRSQASVVVLSGLLGIAVIVGAVVMLLSWFSHRNAQPDSAASTASPSAAPGPDGVQGSGDGGTSVAAAIGSAGASAGSDGQAATDQSPAATGGSGSDQPGAREIADPRAASRVASFSCEGKLSESRYWICTHWSLATRDYNLSLEYKSAVNRSRNPQPLRIARAAWLARLDGLDGNGPAIDKAFDDWAAEVGRMR
jgi:hypothetical protein